MRIVVRSSNNRNITLCLPTGLALNPVLAVAMPKIMLRSGVEMNQRQALAVIKAINRYRRGHPDWKLVEAESSDGSYVEVTI